MAKIIPSVNDSVGQQARMDIKTDATYSGGNFKILTKNQKQQIIFMNKITRSLGFALKEPEGRNFYLRG